MLNDYAGSFDLQWHSLADAAKARSCYWRFVLLELSVLRAEILSDGIGVEMAEIDALLVEAAELVNESEQKKPNYYRSVESLSIFLAVLLFFFFFAKTLQFYLVKRNVVYGSGFTFVSLNNVFPIVIFCGLVGQLQYSIFPPYFIFLAL